jgi:hypothetical protein
LKEKKLKLCVAENNWNIVKSDILQPLEKLHKGPVLGVLACIQTKKITLTYGETNSNSEDDDKEAPSDSEEDTHLDNYSLNSGSKDDNTDESTDSSPSKGRARQTNNLSKKKEKTSKTSKKKSHSSREKAAAKKKVSTSAKKRSHLNRVNRASECDDSTTRADISNTNPVPGTLNDENLNNAGKASTASGRGNATKAIPTLEPVLSTLTNGNN